MYYTIKFKDKINKIISDKASLNKFLSEFKANRPDIYKQLNVSKITQNFKQVIKL